MSDKRMYKTEEENKAKQIIIPHPEFGHVVFTEPTPRQEDILRDYLFRLDQDNQAINMARMIESEMRQDAGSN